MYRKCIGSDPTAARLDFALYEVAGEWESRSGSPRVRIYRNPGRRGGGFYVEVSYKDGTRFSRPVRKYWGGIRYFDPCRNAIMKMKKNVRLQSWSVCMK